MSDLVYSIKDAFSLEQRNGALGQQESEKYFIAPYQRGYKWASFTDDDPVNLLMTDLKDAFSNKSKEYFLQYITICKSQNQSVSVLEVIDGQQRLTTLTLLFSVINARLKEVNKPITHNLLSYEVRPGVTSFFQDFIYSNTESLLSLDWNALITNDSRYDEQDIYYLFHAAKKINELLPENTLEFKIYIENNVKLIINKIEKTVSSEKIFANLNNNKIELTSAELIKALILTKAAREKSGDEKSVRYKEVIEIRSLMGRQWDEIERWANRPEINALYFNNSKYPVEELLYLLAVRISKPIKVLQNKNELFNYFQSLIKRKDETAKQLFYELKKIKNVLNEWYVDTEIYNLIGFLRCIKESDFKIVNFIDKIELTKKDLRNILFNQVKNKIPANVDELEYGENDAEIHRLLFALSVFLNEDRFDFYSFQNEEWSLEHIFPQNPEDFPSELKKADIDLINSIIKSKHKMLEKSDNHIVKSILFKLSKTECILNEEEIIELCDLLESEKLNSIGNMSLLTRSDNSSNSNGMFNKKRHNITKRVSEGSFVPKHTYDVFSKLISEEMDPNLAVWTDRDIDSHRDWISEKLTLILSNS